MTTNAELLVRGIFPKISSSAEGPPVELAMATMCFGAMYGAGGLAEDSAAFPSVETGPLPCLRESGARS